MAEISGHLRKMAHEYDASTGELAYYVRIQEKPDQEDPLGQSQERLLLNDKLGQTIKLEFNGRINCRACGRKTNKSFNQGYCYPCLTTLAECDTCIIKPELCHIDNGTCRDNDFGEKHCNIPHTIYLSLTSGAKIGITRSNQEFTRWADQGAVQAIRVAPVRRRKHAGLLEVKIAEGMSDKTNWRKMLKNEYDDIDLVSLREQILENIAELIETQDFDGEDLDYILDDDTLFDGSYSKLNEFKYPVLEYPKKITSFNFDKNPLVEGTLMGIKGQYLLLDNGVINLRKFTAYDVSVTI